MPEPFKNEPLTDFSIDENRRAMAQAIAHVAENLGQSYPMVIGGERITHALVLHLGDQAATKL